jgi:catechol 2,3-dioxygenase-like lactoylglutathione lyase family enzyme
MFLGLRTVIYPAPDLAASKAWFTSLLGREPYFDEPFYVGYELGGYELGLNPAADVADGARTYWGVPDADVAYAELLAAGASALSPVTEVGEGIRVGEVREPAGTVLGIIENPRFAVTPEGDPGPGPGR